MTPISPEGCAISQTSGAVVIKEIGGSPLKVALARDPEKGRDKWVLPKGHVREGETLESAAIRETMEELGVRRPSLITYLGSFVRDSVEDWGEVVRKRIHLFLLYAHGPSDVRPADYETVTETGWFTVEDAICRLPWKEDREYLQLKLAPMLTESVSNGRAGASSAPDDVG